MRTTDYTNQFKREEKGQHRATLDTKLDDVLSMLLADQALQPRYHDHAMIGNWKDHHDCHI